MSRAAACRGLLFFLAVSLAGVSRPAAGATIVNCTYSGTDMECVAGTCPPAFMNGSSITGSFTYQLMPANPSGSGIFNYTNFTQAVEQHATDFTIANLAKAGTPGTVGSLFTMTYASATQQIVLQANLSATADLPATHVTITLPCSQICVKNLPTSCSKFGPIGTIEITQVTGTAFKISGAITVAQN